MEGKVLLIHPPEQKIYDHKILTYETKELGLLHIGSALFEDGFDIEIIPAIFDINEIKREIKRTFKKCNICIAGITALTYEYPEAKQILRQIKEINPDTITVIGGPHVTWLDKQTLEESPCIDIVARGEGEKIFSELVRSEGSGFKKIKGITFRDNSKIMRTGERAPMKDIKSLSLPLFENYLKIIKRKVKSHPIYNNLAYYLMAARGCHFNCTYCVESKFWSGCRYRKIDSVLEEIDTVLKFFPNAYINFHDSTFTSNPDFVKTLLKKIRRKKYDTEFSVRTRGDRYSKEIATILKKASFNTICFGVEHAHPKVLKIMRRSVPFESIVQALKNAKSVGQNTVTNWIIGHPGDNKKRSMFSYKVAKLLKMKKLIDFFNICIFIPFPGTEPFHNPSKFGLNILTYDWSKYFMNTSRMSKGIQPIIEYDSFSKEEILSMYTAFKELELSSHYDM